MLVICSYSTRDQQCGVYVSTWLAFSVIYSRFLRDWPWVFLWACTVCLYKWIYLHLYGLRYLNVSFHNVPHLRYHVLRQFISWHQHYSRKSKANRGRVKTLRMCINERAWICICESMHSMYICASFKKRKYIFILAWFKTLNDYKCTFTRDCASVLVRDEPYVCVCACVCAL